MMCAPSATWPCTYSGVGPRQGALQHRRFRRAADGGVVPDRSADGGQDTRSSRISGSRRSRCSAVHRGLHRHRTGLEGSRASQHLCACWQTDSPTELVLGKYIGLMRTLIVNLAVMAVAFYLVLPTWARRSGGYVRRGARRRSATAAGGRADLPRARAGHRGRAVLVDVLEPFLSAGLTVGLYVAGQFGADLRNLEAGGRIPGGAVRPRPVLRAAELRSVRRQAQVVHALPMQPGSSRQRGVRSSTSRCCWSASVMIFSRRDFK